MRQRDNALRAGIFPLARMPPLIKGLANLNNGIRLSDAHHRPTDKAMGTWLTKQPKPGIPGWCWQLKLFAPFYESAPLGLPPVLSGPMSKPVAPE